MKPFLSRARKKFGGWAEILMPIWIEQFVGYCTLPPVHTLPHAHLGALGALSSPASDSPLDWVALIMLGLFLGILLVAGMFYFMARRQMKQMQKDRALERPPFEQMMPTSLNLPEQWMAIRTGNIAAVQETLGLTNARRCSWQDGFQINGVEHLFISPPVNGWN